MPRNHMPASESSCSKQQQYYSIFELIRIFFCVNCSYVLDSLICFFLTKRANSLSFSISVKEQKMSRYSDMNKTHSHNCFRVKKKKKQKQKKTGTLLIFYECSVIMPIIFVHNLGESFSVVFVRDRWNNMPKAKFLHCPSFTKKLFQFVWS